MKVSYRGFTAEEWADRFDEQRQTLCTVQEALQEASEEKRQLVLENDRYRKALEWIATIDQRAEPITWSEGFAKMVEVAKGALAEKRIEDPRKGCRDFSHLGASVSAKDEKGEYTLTKCSNCGQIV